jgi:hypothetical protein
VTAEVAAALAETYKPTLILTGRTPVPADPEPAAFVGVADEAGLKKAIAAHLGAGATPKAVGDLFAKVTARREVCAPWTGSAPPGRRPSTCRWT